MPESEAIMVIAISVLHENSVLLSLWSWLCIDINLCAFPLGKVFPREVAPHQEARQTSLSVAMQLALLKIPDLQQLGLHSKGTPAAFRQPRRVLPIVVPVGHAVFKFDQLNRNQ